MIIPHGIVRDPKVARRIENNAAKTGLLVIPDTDAISNLWIVARHLQAPRDTGDLPAFNTELRHAYQSIEQIPGVSYAHVLPSQDARDFVVLFDHHGPRALALEQLAEVPTIAGYATLLGGGAPVPDDVAYVTIKDVSISFDRMATLRLGHLPEAERKQWAVLNASTEPGTAYTILFDPRSVSADPIQWLADENKGTGEYVFRQIVHHRVRSYAGSDVNVTGGIWLQESPMVADLEGQLRFIKASRDAQIHPDYITMLAAGLRKAESTAPGFITNYMRSTYQPDGSPLISNPV
ncbi:hypothetical protein COV94_00930, partial [Candidatus Woesearchaeota archaeon CG11_big_fil_rev_8_21_14_0_20_57_5]